MIRSRFASFVKDFTARFSVFSLGERIALGLILRFPNKLLLSFVSLNDCLIDAWQYFQRFRLYHRFPSALLLSSVDTEFSRACI
jgi:hypothetical protein